MAKEKSQNKYSEIVEQISGTRLNKYSFINDIEYVLGKRLAPTILQALKIDDIYVTLSQCSNIEQNDVDFKIRESLSK